MARRTLSCRKCSAVLDKEQRTEGVCQYCKLKCKIDEEIQNIKLHSEDAAENASTARQLEELEVMREALERKCVKTENDDENMTKREAGYKVPEQDENENSDSEWMDDPDLPEGWKVKADLNSMQKITVISPEQETFENFLSVFIYMANNQEKYHHEDIKKIKFKLIAEGWEDDEKLPSGWKISNQIGDNLFVLLSKEGQLFQTLDAAQDFINGNGDYDETSVLNLEELCMSLVEEYVDQMNIHPDPGVTSAVKKTVLKKALKSEKILSRGTSFPCEQCGQSFRTKSKLLTHASIHEGFKPYQCKQCLRAFSLEVNLKSHMKNHKKEVMKLHTCQVCSKPFYYLREIVEHMEEVHPDVFPYNCDLCGQNFSRSEMLRIHKKNHITQTNVPSCNICNKSFQTNFSMKRHMSMFH